MRNFLRVLRMALTRRLTFAAATITSLLVAFLWGANISAVYPFAEVVMRGESLHGWADKRLAGCDAKLQELDGELDYLDTRLTIIHLPPSTRQELMAQREFLEDRRDAEARVRATAAWVRPYVHRYLPDSAFQTLLLVVAALMVGTLIKGAAIVANSLLSMRLAQLGVLDLRRQFYQHALNMDLARFSEEGSSELISRFTNDAQQLARGMNEVLGPLIREPLKMAACLIGAGLVCWRLLVLSIIITPLAAIIVRWLAKKMKRASRRALEELSSLHRHLSETFGAIQVVKAYNMQRVEQQRFQRTARGVYYRAMKIAFYSSLSKPITETLGLAIVVSALLAGTYLVLNQETSLLGIKICDRPLSISSLMLFYGLLFGASDPVRKLSNFIVVQQAAAAADRIYEVIDRPHRIADSPRPKALPKNIGALAFENVSFAYEPSHRVLDEIDLTIAEGETIALVGPNGCGKTTLMNLVPRFYDPVAGVVRLGGVDLCEAKLSDVRRRVGLVTQRALLFDDTVANNIRYGAPSAGDSRVIAAARQAHADAFITEKLECGYDTVIGPGGSRLSGGQAQRIALARAILRDPEILLLDEATSQIDLESERLIQEALVEFTRKRTTLLISHRPSTLALADRIVVLEAGRIVDVGTQVELLARCPRFRQFVEGPLKRTA